MSLLDTKACQVIAIVEACEGGGMGGSSMLPSAFLEETNFAHNVRQIILHEKYTIEKAKDKAKKK